MESDHELAFRLQMEEAIAASLSLLSTSPVAEASTLAASSSRLNSPELVDRNSVGVFNRPAVVRDNLKIDRSDRESSEAETRRMSFDLSRGIRDQKFAHGVTRNPSAKCVECGDHIQVPSGEGSSSSARPLAKYETYRLYFKGLLSEERVGNSKVTLCGIGVAICDPRDNLIFELKKPLKGIVNRRTAELEALLEGLANAFSLDIKRIVFYCDYYPLYQYVKRKWYPKQRKVASLMEKVTILQRKFAYCSPYFIQRYGIKFAFKLARDAIASEMAKPAESNSGNNLKETCVICLEETNMDQMFPIAGCLHSYCFSCMKQHVEAKLLHGTIPKCPHERCTSELNINSCEKFLTPKLIEIMKQRLKEASIPPTDKVYCPFPRCSELMSKSQASAYARKESVQFRNFGGRKCVKCNGCFCINCKVPWHFNMRCKEYKRLNPSPSEDTKLKSLASRQLWRQCVKCKHMIELAEGCYHMTCRCGHEFCYTCGAEWKTVENQKEKKATCSCPLFDDDYEDEDEDDEDEDEDEDDEDEDDENEDYEDYDYTSDDYEDDDDGILIFS